MSEHTILLIMLGFDAIMGTVVPLEFAINEYRHWSGRMTTSPSQPRMRWRVVALLAAFLFVMAATFVYPKLSEPVPQTPFTVDWLTKERQDTFRTGAVSIINASGNMPNTEIRTVSEPDVGNFAQAISDLFIGAGLKTYIDSQGHRVGVPSARLVPGVTIVAPVPSLSAEAIRVGLERIGIQTRRSTDPLRSGDYLVVEIGPPP